MPFRKKNDKFLLPFGLSLERGRCGAAVKEFGEWYNVKAIKNAPYDYGLIIVASRERLFPLFMSLSEFADEPCVAFFIHYLPRPEMAFTSDELPKRELLDAFTRHSFQLVNDGFVSFGISSDEIEISVEDHKEFIVFCKSSRQVLAVLDEYGIPMKPGTKWIHDVEHVHVPIHMLFDDPMVMHASEPVPKEELRKYNSDPKGYSDFYVDFIKRLRMRPAEDYAPKQRDHVHPG